MPLVVQSIDEAKQTQSSPDARVRVATILVLHQHPSDMMAATPPLQSSTVAARSRRATNQVNAYQRRTRAVQSSSCAEVSFFSCPICIVHGLQPKLILPSRCCCHFGSSKPFWLKPPVASAQCGAPFSLLPGEQAIRGGICREFFPLWGRFWCGHCRCPF